MPEDRPLPLSAKLTADSSREEVLAALAEQDARDAEYEKTLAELEWPDVPEGFEGCVWSKCGTAVAMYGRREENPTIAAQRRAGEEDQSTPGWEGA